MLKDKIILNNKLEKMWREGVVILICYHLLYQMYWDIEETARKIQDSQSADIELIPRTFEYKPGI
jgi:hypothetical protein